MRVDDTCTLFEVYDLFYVARHFTPQSYIRLVIFMCVRVCVRIREIEMASNEKRCVEFVVEIDK